VPVRRLGWRTKEWSEHPDVPTGFIHPWQLGINPDQHAVMPGGHDLTRRLYEEAEYFARRWLALRGQAAA
jgi:hypothetical protein